MGLNALSIVLGLFSSVILVAVCFIHGFDPFHIRLARVVDLARGSFGWKSIFFDGLFFLCRVGCGDMLFMNFSTSMLIMTLSDRDLPPKLTFLLVKLFYIVF